jgi:hypothetical protein
MIFISSIYNTLILTFNISSYTISILDSTYFPLDLHFCLLSTGFTRFPMDQSFSTKHSVLAWMRIKWVKCLLFDNKTCGLYKPFPNLITWPSFCWWPFPNLITWPSFCWWPFPNLITWPSFCWCGSHDYCIYLNRQTTISKFNGFSLHSQFSQHLAHKKEPQKPPVVVAVSRNKTSGLSKILMCITITIRTDSDPSPLIRFLLSD